MIKTIDEYDRHSSQTVQMTDISDIDEYDFDDQNGEALSSIGRKVKIDLADMDYKSWRDSFGKGRGNIRIALPHDFRHYAGT